MFVIDDRQTIHLTRGDVAIIEISVDTSDNERYIFRPGDVIRLRVFEQKQHDEIVLIKDVIVESETETVDIELLSTDTKIGSIIEKPVNYWYEVELNPDTHPQTIIGYDMSGPKIFKLYPEGGDN